MHNFVVKSNESACRKSVRLRLEQVMNYRYLLPFLVPCGIVFSQQFIAIYSPFDEVTKLFICQNGDPFLKQPYLINPYNFYDLFAWGHS